MHEPPPDPRAANHAGPPTPEDDQAADELLEQLAGASLFDTPPAPPPLVRSWPRPSPPPAEPPPASEPPRAP